MQHKKSNLKILLLVFIVSIIWQSCQYRPFLKYYFPSKKTHVAKFNKWDKFVGFNANPLRTAYNVTCYDWLVHVSAEQKQISSNMKIYFQMRIFFWTW